MVMLAIFLVIFVGIMTGISGDMAGLRWLKFTGVFIAIAGMFSIAGASLIMSMPKNGRRKPKHIDPPTSLERADTTNKLLPIAETDYVPSIVENTTDLLPAAKVKSKKQS
jgi:hypothetical protein